jgi:4-hydroxy-3-methylbut-2-enyl diphosphate reductase
MDAALEASARFGHSGPVRTLGPLIHNPQALAHLAHRGIREAASIDELHHGAVIIRAHGIPKEEHHVLKTRHATGRLRLSNATCPEVAKVQAIVRRFSGKGYFTVILGSASHPEVIALRTFASNGYVVVADLGEAQALSDQALRKVLVVAQTTFRIHDFHEIARELKTRGGDVVIKNTVCRDTWERQDEAREIADLVNAAVVVGGRSSNNTRHLLEVVQKAGKPVQLVESSEELDLKDLLRYETVGVLAGASTPTWTVDEVVEALQNAGTQRTFQFLSKRTAGILQLPYALAWAVLAILLHTILHWKTDWAGPVLPAAFILSLCAFMPYLDPFGMIAKGMVRGRFLKKYQWAFLGVGLIGSLVTLGAAARLGLRVLIGVVVRAGIASLYHRNFHALALLGWVAFLGLR